MSNNEKKIIIAADIFSPDIGGPATYSKNLADELKRAGYDIQVICYGDKDEIISDEYKIIKIGRNRKIFARYFNYFITLIKISGKSDLTYAQGPVSAGLPTFLASKISGKKYILKVVGDYAWEQGSSRFGVQDGIDEFQNKKYSFKVEILRSIQKMVAKNALSVITPSYYLQGIVEGWGVKKEKIKVIYNAVNFDDVNISDKKWAQEKIGINGKIIVSIARLVPWKGFEMLIKIWPELLKKNQDLKLIIVGDGPEQDNLERLIKTNNLIENVFLVGKKNHQEISDYFSSADIFVLNSGYEGLSHVLIEAMAHKVPIIASNKGGNSELVKNNENGLLVEYNDSQAWQEAILNLSKNKELKENFINNSLKNLDKFKYSTMIDNTLDFLKKVI